MNKSLVEISSEIMTLMGEAEVNGLNDQLKARFSELFKAEAEKVDSIVRYDKYLDSQVEFLKKEREFLDNEIKKLERKKDNMRDFCQHVLMSYGLVEIKGAVGHKISLRETQSVEVRDFDKLPDHCVVKKISLQPDKVKIKEKIKAGETVPGAELVTNTSVWFK